jgi:SNF family Na+-dependent transporter
MTMALNTWIFSGCGGDRPLHDDGERVGEAMPGSTIAIPMAHAYFGPQGAIEIAHGGAFNLGFATMPVVFQQLPWGMVFGTAGFFL